MQHLNKNYAELKIKVILTLFYLGGFLFFWFLGPILIRILKRGLIKRESKLTESAPWIFTSFHYFFRAFSIFCLIFILLVWTGLIQISNNY